MRHHESTMSSLKPAAITLCFVLVLSGNLFAANTSCRAFDQFTDVNCEDLSARLDNFAVTLANEPVAQATIIVYEGDYRRGRKPRFGEAQAYAARIKDYLVNHRGVDSNRITIVDGGVREEFTVQLYACPVNLNPTPYPTLELLDIKFRRGKIYKREYRWSCLG